MKFKNLLIIFIIIVGVISILSNFKTGGLSPSIFSFFIAEQGEDEVLFKAGYLDRTNFVTQYPLGNFLLTSSDLKFLCVDKNKEFFAPQPANSCWESKINDINAIYKQTIDFDYFTVRFQPQGHYVQELGFIKPSEQKINWFIKLSDNVININKLENPKVINAGIQTKYSFTVDSKIDGLMGGFVIKTTKGLFRSENIEIKRVTFSKGNNIFTNTINSDVFGNVKITITPFVTLYDYSQGFTSQNTGYCFFDRDNKMFCVQKKDITVKTTPLIYDFNVVPQSVDVDKKISTRCFTQNDCQQGFTCIKNICEFGAQKFNIIDWIYTFIRNLKAVLIG